MKKKRFSWNIRYGYLILLEEERTDKKWSEDDSGYRISQMSHFKLKDIGMLPIFTALILMIILV